MLTICTGMRNGNDIFMDCLAKSSVKKELSMLDILFSLTLCLLQVLCKCCRASYIGAARASQFIKLESNKDS